MKDRVQNPDVTNTYMQRAVTCSRTVFVFTHYGHTNIKLTAINQKSAKSPSIPCNAVMLSCSVGDSLCGRLCNEAHETAWAVGKPCAVIP